MIEDLRGKAVLITGASSGIGAAAARAFGREGASVAVHYNQSQSDAEQVAADVSGSGGEAFIVKGDVSQPQEVERVVANTLSRFGRVDVLVNNAGGLIRRAAPEAITDELFDEVIRLNCMSLVVAVRSVVPHFRARGSGNIINVSSVAAQRGGAMGSALYSSAKGFVLTMTRSLARELSPYGIRVNQVAPGVIMTRFHEQHSSRDMLDSLVRLIPLGRIGTAEECAGAFLFLASDRLSSYITGQTIHVNGGQEMA